MLDFLISHLEKWSTFISAVAAVLTAVATFFLWRVTKLLAKETTRMVESSSQPHIVVTLEPNAWAAFYFDINVANTGNAPAYNIEVEFDPPLINAEYREDKKHSIPFRKISVLKNGQMLSSNLCEYNQIKENVYKVVISWSKQANSIEREFNEYEYDMSSFEGINYLGARNPMTQIAEQIKKIREDWRPITQGSKKIKTDNYSSDDREKERKDRDEWYQKTIESREKRT
ncbi:hypothetical protein HV073_06665 [Klebsiella michiganensis]|uniref:hypothetical protein n=1 Tax=Enterobacteriaceae TaxID=543 RepID=UPI0015F5273B|nr:hypothetical protein [Klebsiella michiganensis]MBA8051251.1 hypothetical protein [Klebsiella michiganensis]